MGTQPVDAYRWNYYACRMWNAKSFAAWRLARVGGFCKATMQPIWSPIFAFNFWPHQWRANYQLTRNFNYETDDYGIPAN
eukprot:NODE_2575_length_417_cov_68.086957_g2494_i0.p1 GENE.NODE_2575_length_417_cov_68.086957_g2494_i0~~NODE_2575_length_417_cov_68.086957_g2494_i0.p1  ORF type:complete len:80 (-),score=1.40 NODE_2575_length_417_cov_68.086957_g2494_i0:135-374(-)